MKPHKKNKIKYLWSIQTKKSILWLIIFSILLTGVLTLRNSRILPFHRIKIIMTSTHLKISELKNIVIQHINGGFFSFNARELQSALIKLPLVHNVSIRKRWPSELDIVVVEEKPLVRWNQNQLISNLDTLFNLPVEHPSVVIIPKDLPQLKGPDDSEKIVLSRFEQFNQLLAPLHMKVIFLKVNSHETWFLILNNHIQVYLGRKNIDQRFKKLIRFYQKIIGNRSHQVNYIDLQYSNGLAVQWKSEST